MSLHARLVRELHLETLLPRAPKSLDLGHVEQLLAGRCVLVTGAGGSIGSELSRQLVQFRPSSLVLFERYEHNLYELLTHLSETHLASGTEVHAVLGDVTDPRAVDDLFASHRPALVFHAAAYKQVPLMESNACQVVWNNVTGTRTVLEAAVRTGSERFVLVSSDKAVNPISVMGATKRVAELLCQASWPADETARLAVRFGNILGSNGSVVPRFVEQAMQGGPLTVTHPEVCRYFMLASEAVQLLLHTTVLGESGAIYVFEMGEPIKVVDLARDVIRLTGHDPDELPIRFIGLRPGERLTESLVGEGETPVTGPHDRVLRITSAEKPPDSFLSRVQPLEAAAATGDTATVLAQLSQIVPTFNSTHTPLHPHPTRT